MVDTDILWSACVPNTPRKKGGHFHLDAFSYCKISQSLGWPEKVPANLVATELKKHVPQDAFSEIVCHESKTASFLLHNEYSDTILRASGRDGVFFKLKKPSSDEDDSEMLLHWTPLCHLQKNQMS